MGAAAGAQLLGMTAPASGMAPGSTQSRVAAPVQATAVAPALTPGLAYVLLDPMAFVPGNPQTDPRVQSISGGVSTRAAFRLHAPLVVPVGGALKELVVAYETPPPASGPAFLIFKKPLDGGGLSQVAVLALPQGSGSLLASTALNETIDGSATYRLDFYVGFTDPTDILHGVRVGYVPPPQAFVPIQPVPRALDTRITGGKLNPNEERFVALAGVPGFARAAVMNLTVTETEGAGYVSAFAADESWSGNSSINWFGNEQNLANGVISAVDTNGRVKIRGGVARTHVVIDVQGYLL